MNTAYRNAIANHGGSIITHIALVDGGGNEPSGGGYTRLSVSWTTASDGLIRPTADLPFDIPAGFTVAAWRGYSAASGGTNYDGQSLTSTPFSNPGIYTLRADQTSIAHDAA